MLSSLRLAVLGGQRSFIYSLTSLRDKKLLVAMHEQGLLRGFELRGSYVIFNLRRLYIQNFCVFSTPFHTIGRVRREAKKATLKYKHISRLCRRQGRHPFYFFSTDRGIIGG